MNREVRRVCDELLTDRFAAAGNVDAEVIRNRVDDYDKIMAPLLPLISVGAFWGKTSHIQLWTECIEAVANVYTDIRQWNGMKTLLELRLYPPLQMLYAAGIGAYLNGQFQTLYPLLCKLKFQRLSEVKPLHQEVYVWKERFRLDWNQYINGGSERPTPISDHLLVLMKNATCSLTLDRNSLELKFDEFEYFIGLSEVFEAGKDPDWTWAPIGRFVWAYKRSSIDIAHFGNRVTEDAASHSSIWPPLEAGFFGGSEDNLRTTVKNYESFLGRVRDELRIW